MMKLITNTTLKELLSVSAQPCLSVYMPTHRSHPENQQDPTKFKKLLKELEASLGGLYAEKDIIGFLEPLKALAEDSKFWNHTPDGLAVFSSKGFFRVIGLPMTVPPLAIVADSFHTKPLRRYLQSVDRYQILGLSRHDIRLFEGNRHAVSEIKIPEGVPQTIEEALGSELTEGHLTAAAYGGAGAQQPAMHHGHGGKKDEVDKDAERFFRVVADAVYEQVSKPSRLPLILAALPEHHNLFHKLNKNPHLLEKGITTHPDSIPADELAKHAWEVMEPAYLQKLEGIADDFHTAKANGTGSDQVKEIAAAAAAGRVNILLAEEGLRIAGKITDRTTGAIETGDTQDPEIDDLPDDIAELVTEMGGRVIIMPKGKTPSKSGLAAIYRF